MAAQRRRKLAVWKFASCDGCQLSLLDLEDELLDLVSHFDVALFLEASRRASSGPYDLSLVEGSITTPQDAERIRRVRRSSKYLVTIGACATAGGIQALRNFADVREFASVSTRLRSTSAPWAPRLPSPLTCRWTSSCKGVPSTSGCCWRLSALT